MITVIARATVADVDAFLPVFSSRGRELRARHGARSALVHRDPDRADGVVVVFRWEDRAGFDAFLADPDVPEAMRASGTIGRPEFTVLELLAELDA